MELLILVAGQWLLPRLHLLHQLVASPEPMLGSKSPTTQLSSMLKKGKHL